MQQTDQHPSEVREARRALLDAIYAIHAGGGQIRVSEPLARDLEAAWRRYDDAIRDEAAGPRGAGPSDAEREKAWAQRQEWLVTHGNPRLGCHEDFDAGWNAALAVR